MAGDMTDRLVPQEVIDDAWVGLVGALNHPQGHCWGTAHRDGPMTYEKADTPCFVCTALVALTPYKHGDRNRMEKCDTDCGEHYDGKHWTVI